MDSAGLQEPDTAWPGGQGPSLFLRGPSATGARPRPSLSVPVLGWGGGRGTLLGINFTLWTLLLSCSLLPGEGPALGPWLCSSPWFPSLGLIKLCDGVRPALTGRGHLDSDPIFAPEPLGDLGHSSLPVGAKGKQIGVRGSLPCSWPSSLAAMVVAAFHQVGVVGLQ